MNERFELKKNGKSMT